MDLLSGIAFLVRVVVRFDNVASLDVEHHVLERYFSPGFKQRVLGRTPGYRFHSTNRRTTCAYCIPAVFRRLTPAFSGGARPQGETRGLPTESLARPSLKVRHVQMPR